MTPQAYLDNIKAKTGKTPEDFRALAVERGLVRAGEIVAWLNAEYGLGYGHAGAIYYVIAHPDDVGASTDDRTGALFAGSKEKWRPAYDALAAEIAGFGADVELAPNMTYVNVRRGGKKIAIIQPSSAERLDIGIKLKGVAPSGQLEVAGSWNNMVTHRVRIGDPGQIDAEVLGWLKQACDASEEPRDMADANAGELGDPQESDLPMGLSNPARRALAEAGCWRLDQVAGLTEGEIKQLHGVGPKALDHLRRALGGKGLSFAPEMASQVNGDRQ